MMSRAFVRLLLSSLPTKPEDGKWTLLGPCLDFMVGVLHVNTSFTMIFVAAFGAMQTDAPASDSNIQTDTLTWHEMRGIRVTLSCTYLHSPECRHRLTTLALSVEGVRYLTAWGLRKSKDFPDPCEHPAIFSLCLQKSNPASVTLGFVASLLDGSSSRLALLFRPAGFKSFADWHDSSPGQASYSRATFFSCAAWSYRRWISKYGTCSIYEPFVCANPEATGYTCIVHLTGIFLSL